MKSNFGLKAPAISAILACAVMATSCASSDFANGMEGFTGAVEGFTERVRSQNTLLNNSKVEMTGSYAFGEVSISAAGAHVLTPAQLDDARSDVRWRYIRASDANDVDEQTAWAEVSKEFEEEFTTLNDVLVFKIENQSYDDVDASGASVLLVDAGNNRKEQAVFNERALETLNEKAFVLDRESGERVEYTSGKLGVVPALSTKYYGIIIPRMKAGSYTAVVSNFPGADGRLGFEVTKK